MSSAITFPKSSNRFHVSLEMDFLWCSFTETEAKPSSNHQIHEHMHSQYCVSVKYIQNHWKIYWFCLVYSWDPLCHKGNCYVCLCSVSSVILMEYSYVISVTYQEESVPEVEKLKSAGQNEIPVGHSHLKIWDRDNQGQHRPTQQHKCLLHRSLT